MTTLMDLTAVQGEAESGRPQRIAELVRDATGRRWVGIYAVTDREVRNLAWDGPGPPAYPNFPVDQGLTATAIATGETVVSNDVANDPRYLTALESTGSEVIVPVVARGRVVGTIDVEDERTDAFSDDDVRLLEEVAERMCALYDWRVRVADPARDAARCLEIYAPYVIDSAISFEDSPPTVEEFEARMRSYMATHPWLVAESPDGRLAGYAYASPHRPRAAYRWAVEVAIYVDPEYQGQGLGRRLYGELFERLRRQGFQAAFAGVATPNDASIRLHEAMGFESIGVFRRIGWKAGAWRDVSWWQLDLIPPANEPPAEPKPPSDA
jgi:L-amino acid N-acyltransferase YncA/putative methionine-R-sulfoxide reductase with GAF domain